jgi:hypothetical protein
MRRRAPFVALVVLAVGAPAARAQVKEPAELLPASTLASVEFRQPARLARELAALVKGSALEDMPGTVALFRERHANAESWFLSDLVGFSLFLSPEMLAEGGRLRGGILGLTGIDKEKGPRYVGVLLTGDSNVPGIFYRGQMTFSNVRLAGQCEGVSIFQERRVSYSYAAPAAPGAPAASTRKVEDSGPAMALLPGALVVGSPPEAVKDVIRRLKGKSGDPALASVSAYREALGRDDRPGLFAYANVAALAAAVDESMANASQGSVAEWRAAKALFNPRAIRGATVALTLQNGAVELQARVRTEPGEKSPLLELLPDGKAPVELLQFVPRDATVAGAAGLGDGEQRWEKALQLLDTVVPAPRPPGRAIDAVRELERQVKLNLGKDVFGRLSGVALFADAREGKRPGGPVLILQGKDAKAGRALEQEVLPRLFGLLGGGATPAATREEVDGQPIHSLAGVKLPWGKGAYFGRSGAVLVVGADRQRVADALSTGRKKAGLASDEAVATGTRDLGGPALVGVASLGRLAVEAFKESERWANPQLLAPTPAPGAAAPPGGGRAARVEPGKVTEAGEKRAREFGRAFAPLPPLVFGLTRQPDGLALTARQPQLRRASARAIDLWVEAALERSVRRRMGFGAVGATSAPAPAKAATPAKDKPKK